METLHIEKIIDPLAEFFSGLLFFCAVYQPNNSQHVTVAHHILKIYEYNKNVELWGC